MRSPETSTSTFGRLALLSALALSQPACHKSPEVDASVSQVHAAVTKVEQNPVTPQKNEKVKESDELTDRVNAAIEAAKIQNPTNKELISKLFVFLLKGEDYSPVEGFPYISTRKAFGTDHSDDFSTGVMAADLGVKMDVGTIHSDALAVFVKLPLDDKFLIAHSTTAVLPGINEAADSYPRYKTLFDNGTFERCPGDMDFAKRNISNESLRDPACKEGTLVAEYHGQGEFPKFVMRMMHRLGVPASTVTSIATQVKKTVLGK